MKHESYKLCCTVLYVLHGTLRGLGTNSAEDLERQRRVGLLAD